jgi:MFS family permease
VAAIVACFVILLQSNMAGPVYPLWQEDLGFSPGVINILFAVYPAGVLTALFGVMRILNRLTWRATLMASVATGIVAAILFVLARDPWTLGLARYVCGLSVGIVLSTGASAITATLERRNVRGAARLAAIIISAGFACGALFAGLMADNLPRPTILTWEVELVALVAALVYLVVDPGLKSIDRCHRDRVAGLGALSQSLLPVGQRRAAMVTATWVCVACGISCAVFQSIGSAYLKGLLDADSATFSGLLVFLVFGSAFAGQLLMANASARRQADRKSVV